MTLVERLRTAGCVFAEDEAAILVEAAAGDDDRLAAMLARRVAGEPLEHVVGWVEFAGLRIEVDPGVFVPRPRTEALVAFAIDAVRARDVSRPVILDLCCGCGALGVATAAAFDGAQLHASDVDPAAAAVAWRNVEPRGGEVSVGDLDDAVPTTLAGCVDVLLANVPYVPTGDLQLLPRDVREHERRVALDGGRDGLEVARRVAAVAPRWLAPGGAVLMEVTEAQVPALLAALETAGLQPRVQRDEELDATVVSGRASGWRAPSAGRPPEP